MWGGSQVRDWVHIEDLTDAIVYAIEHFPRGVPVQIGTGTGTDFFTLAELVADAVGYSPRISGDATKQASSPRRVADTALAQKSGWRASISLQQGIEMALKESQARLGEDQGRELRSEPIHLSKT